MVHESGQSTLKGMVHAGEMVSKVTDHKHKDLSLDPQSTRESQMWWHTSVTSALGRWEIDGTLELFGQTDC